MCVWLVRHLLYRAAPAADARSLSLSLPLRVRARAWDGIDIHTKAAVVFMSFPAFLIQYLTFSLHLTLLSRTSDAIEPFMEDPTVTSGSSRSQA